MGAELVAADCNTASPDPHSFRYWYSAHAAYFQEEERLASDALRSLPARILLDVKVKGRVPMSRTLRELTQRGREGFRGHHGSAGLANAQVQNILFLLFLPGVVPVTKTAAQPINTQPV
ncbi:hypothetical protein P4O66_004153 [Electrophorus voltai]|uniref:Uncharacterized protein n=1 Tax=Electrophorus voltai TaxID=2609070 RepID=A0AAD8YNV6_9TELE|nr:hypothetical protein P4O66_004153 [Electrophorus voltai]